MTNKSISDADALVVFRVGPVYCCAPTMAVISIVMPPEFTALPGVSSAEPGIFKSAHGIVHVVDLRKRFGVDVADTSPMGRIIVAEVESGRDGFWVDEIIDVIQFPVSGWGVVPIYIPRDVFLKTLMLNNSIHLYTDFDCLHKLKVNGLLREHIAILKREESNGSEKERAAEGAPAPNVKELEKEKAGRSQAKVAEINSIDESSGAVEMMAANKPAQKPGDKKTGERVEGFAVADSHVDKSPLLGHVTNAEGRAVSFQYSGPVDNEVPVTEVDDVWNVVPQLIDNKKQQDGFESAGVEKNDSVYLFVFAIAAICVITIFLMFNLPDFKVDSATNAAREPLVDNVDREDETDRFGSLVDHAVNGNVIDDKVLIDNQLSENKVNVNHAELQKDAEGITIIVSEELIVDTVSEPNDQVEIEASRNGVVDNAISLDGGPGGKLATKDEINTNRPVVNDGRVKSLTLKDEYNTKVIIHIVKKGDTLWHIALRYINNPYRYPELARLSKINNPDRIYPGNRVKIIIKTRKK